MGSYKWGYKSPNMGYKKTVTLLISLLITTHEPPSSAYLNPKETTVFGGLPQGF